MDVETLCSVVNDNQRMQEKCEEFGDRMIKHVPQADQREVLTAMLEDISSEYVSFSVHAIGYLSRAVLRDLEEPVFKQLFTAAWENNYGDSLSSVIVATLQDYFQDVKVWLPDYFYCKFVKETLHTLTGLYMMQLRRYGSSTGSGHYEGAIAAARKMILDMEAFQAFFETFTDELRRGGLKPSSSSSSSSSAVAEELEPLANLATVCSRDGDKPYPRDDVVALFNRFGADGLRLSLAAFSCNRALSKPQRHDRLDATYRLFDKGTGTGKYTSKLSDMFKSITDHPVDRAPPPPQAAASSGGGGTPGGASGGGTAGGGSASKAKAPPPSMTKSKSFWG